MAVNPTTVLSPVTRLRGLRVIYISAPPIQQWSLAIGLWDGERALLVRWNGDADHLMGNPVSHARPTWYVLPQDFHVPILGLVPNPNRASAGAWLGGGNPTQWQQVHWQGV